MEQQRKAESEAGAFARKALKGYPRGTIITVKVDTYDVNKVREFINRRGKEIESERVVRTLVGSNAQTIQVN